MDSENRARTTLHNPLGDAAYENMSQTGAAMSRYNNEARLNPLGRIDDGLVGDTALYDPKQ
jgi:hypothetical protein